MLENILQNPGLHHIAEIIFWNLNHEELEFCHLINQPCKQILENPMFWLKKFIRKGLPIKDQMDDWTKAIQLTKDTVLEKIVLLYLKKTSKNKRVVDLPCYIDEKIINISQNFLHHHTGCNFDFLVDACCGYGNEGIVQMLAPLTDDNPNQSLNGDLQTLIYLAASKGHTEKVKILAPLTDNPNAPDADGVLPMHKAAEFGFTDVVKILASLTDNPNRPDRYGYTPISSAAVNGYTEIVKILAPMTDNPNAPDEDGDAPIDLAKERGHQEIVRILESHRKPAAKRSRLE